MGAHQGCTMWLDRLGIPSSEGTFMKCFNLQSVHGRGDGASLHHTVTHEPSLRVICWSDRFVLTVHLPAGDPRRRPTVNRLSDWSPPHNKPNCSDFPSVSQLPMWMGHALFLCETKRQDVVHRAGVTNIVKRNKRLRALESFYWLELMVWQSIMCWGVWEASCFLNL